MRNNKEEKDNGIKYSDMRNLRLIVCMLIVFGFATQQSFAQQDPMYTQYYFNMQTINPAYAGTWDRLGISVLGRYQWVGMDGAPTTYTASLQSPIRLENVALGLNMVADKVGKEKRISVSGDYSYRVKVSANSDLRLGLKGNVTNYSNDLNDYTTYPDGQTEIYSGNFDSKYKLNFGVGCFLSSDRYYIGFSIPRLLNTTIEGEYNTAYSEMRHYFLSAGYVWDIGNDLKFKPTVLVKAVENASVQTDFTANFLIMDKVWLGAMYRIQNAYGFIAQFVIQEHVRIGYAVDFSTSKIVSNSGTHEIMLSYEFGKRKRWTSPRMF